MSLRDLDGLFISATVSSLFINNTFFKPMRVLLTWHFDSRILSMNLVSNHLPEVFFEFYSAHPRLRPPCVFVLFLRIVDKLDFCSYSTAPNSGNFYAAHSRVALWISIIVEIHMVFVSVKHQENKVPNPNEVLFWTWLDSAVIEIF